MSREQESHLLLNIKMGPGEEELKSSSKAPIILCIQRAGCKNTTSLPVLLQCEGVHIS